MKRSLNEISGMVLKAARGAGVPLGYCEDLAAAAGYMAATDAASLMCLREVLIDAPITPVIQKTGTSIRIEKGAICETAPLCADALRTDVTEVTVVNCAAPQLVFALCAVAGVGVVHQFNGTDLILTPASDAPAMPRAGSVTVSDQLWVFLSDLAAKTYVPATEASRLAGAGAGLTDND